MIQTQVVFGVTITSELLISFKVVHSEFSLCDDHMLMTILLILKFWYLFQIRMKVGIVAPINETCRSLATRLLETGMKVAFLCPSKMDEDLAETMALELAVLGIEQDNLHFRQKSFSVVKHDLTDCDVVGGCLR